MTPYEAIEYMFEQMDESAQYGASDTEPRAVFADILEAHLNGLEPRIPDTAEGWQLYSDMRGAGLVAGILHDAAVLVVDAMNRDHRAAMKAVEYFYGGMP